MMFPHASGLAAFAIDVVPIKYAAWRVPMPNGFLLPRVRRDTLDGQINFDEAFGILGHLHSGRISIAE
jgi:hypothetical protein